MQPSRLPPTQGTEGEVYAHWALGLATCILLRVLQTLNA